MNAIQHRGKHHHKINSLYTHKSSPSRYYCTLTFKTLVAKKHYRIMENDSKINQCARNRYTTSVDNDSGHAKDISPLRHLLGHEEDAQLGDDRPLHARLAFPALSSPSLFAPTILDPEAAHVDISDTTSSHSSAEFHNMFMKSVYSQSNLYSNSRSAGLSAAEIEEISKSVKLTLKERQLVDLLKECVLYYQLDVVLRFAGGWVRDKLMGIESDDIDVSIDRMMGEAFAVKFNAYLSMCGWPVSHIGIIAARPNQSKHLETATIDVLGQKIDFVNLRAEIYAQYSSPSERAHARPEAKAKGQQGRIPTAVKFGTPVEDAHRRDITINALFYNIHTGLVEDYTHFGLSDLKAHYIRTPLPAKDIFLDDPLRILRVIRFASRFNYAIDPEIQEAVKLDTVRHAFREKITRERIGTELKKMLYGPNPALSLHYIHQFGVHGHVFMLPPIRAWTPPVPTSEWLWRESEQLAHIYTRLLEIFLPLIGPDLHPSPPQSALLHEARTPEAKVAGEDVENLITFERVEYPLVPVIQHCVWLGVSLLPYRYYTSQKIGLDRGPVVPVNEIICRSSLKLSNYQTDQILKTVQIVDYIVEFVSKYDPPFDPVQLASCMRLSGPRWEIAWILAHTVLYYNQYIVPKMKNYSPDGQHRVSWQEDAHALSKHRSMHDISYSVPHKDEELAWIDSLLPFLPHSNSANLETIQHKMSRFRTAVFEHHLDQLWRTKPPLNGKQVIALLNIKKPDAYLSRILCELVQWRLLSMPLKKMSVRDDKSKQDRPHVAEPALDVQQAISNEAAAEAVLMIAATMKNKLMATDYPPKEF